MTKIQTVVTFEEADILEVLRAKATEAIGGAPAMGSSIVLRGVTPENPNEPVAVTELRAVVTFADKTGN